jgi:hypothetical protein
MPNVPCRRPQEGPPRRTPWEGTPPGESPTERSLQEGLPQRFTPRSPHQHPPKKPTQLRNDKCICFPPPSIPLWAGSVHVSFLWCVWLVGGSLRGSWRGSLGLVPLGLGLAPPWSECMFSAADLGGVLESSRAILGAIQDRPGQSGVMLGPSWVLLGPPGVILGPSRNILKPSWDHPGFSWAHPGTIRSHPGAILGGPSQAIVGHPGAILGDLGSSLGSSRGYPGLSWGHSEAIWAILGPSGPSWEHHGPSWAILGAFWAILGAFIPHSSSVPPSLLNNSPIKPPSILFFGTVAERASVDVDNKFAIR